MSRLLEEAKYLILVSKLRRTLKNNPPGATSAAVYTQKTMGNNKVSKFDTLSCLILPFV